MFKSFLTSFKKFFVQDVPPDLSACEGGCCKSSCSKTEFNTCVDRHFHRIIETRKQIDTSDINFDAIQDDEH